MQKLYKAKESTMQKSEMQSIRIYTFDCSTKLTNLTPQSKFWLRRKVSREISMKNFQVSMSDGRAQVENLLRYLSMWMIF